MMIHICCQYSDPAEQDYAVAYPADFMLIMGLAYCDDHGAYYTCTDAVAAWRAPIDTKNQVQLLVWRGLLAHSEAAKIILYFT
jgi:hypothetical protein